MRHVAAYYFTDSWRAAHEFPWWNFWFRQHLSSLSTGIFFTFFFNRNLFL